MEESILKSTKNTLGIADNFTAYDGEITLFINSTLSTLEQLGVGTGVPIEGAESKWDAHFPGVVPDRLSLVKTIVHLKAKLAFDPPGTSYSIEAFEKQVEEHIQRLHIKVEGDRVIPSRTEEVEV